MPTNVPVPTVVAGNIYTPTMYNNFLSANFNKLLNTAHRVLTVAQFAALSSPEGTKGTVAPDEVYLEVDATNGVVWHLHWESTDGSSSKWRYIGGPPLWSEITTLESRTNTAFGALATAGPSVPLPRLGDYDVTIGAESGQDGGSSDALMSYDIGGTGAVDADAVITHNVLGYVTGSRPRRKTGLTAVTLTAKYRCIGVGQGEWGNRFMAVTPVRIG